MDKRLLFALTRKEVYTLLIYFFIQKHLIKSSINGNKSTSKRWKRHRYKSSVKKSSLNLQNYKFLKMNFFQKINSQLTPELKS